jgi:hypothetical protein
MRSPLVAAMLLLAVKAAVAQSIDDQVGECRRMALQEYNDSVSQFDAAATKEKLQFDEWTEKARILVEALKKAQRSSGQFGDAAAFDTIAKSPARVAVETSADIDATLAAVEQTLKAIERQREATPNDPSLYCSYVFVFNHRGTLQRLSRYATIHQLLIKAIERYFQMRILVASSISKTEYEKDRSSISDTLVDLYVQEKTSADHTRNMLAQLRKQ